MTAPLTPESPSDGIPVHDLGCRCWPHVSEADALAQIERVALAEYRAGKTAATAAMTAPLTPESEEFIEDARIVGILDGAMGSNEPYWRNSLAAIEAAAIARYAEGLVERVARGLYEAGWIKSWRDTPWDKQPADAHEEWCAEARRLLALDAPEDNPDWYAAQLLSTPSGKAILDRLARAEAAVPDDPWLYDDGRGYGLTCYSCVQWKDLGHRENCKWLAARPAR
jgi:hypothetical protein